MLTKGGRERCTPSHPAVLTEDPSRGGGLGAKAVVSAQCPGGRGHQSWVPTARPEAQTEDKLDPTPPGGLAPPQTGSPLLTAALQPLPRRGPAALSRLGDPSGAQASWGLRGGAWNPSGTEWEMAPSRGPGHRDRQGDNPVSAAVSLPRGEGVCKGVNVTVHPTGLQGQYQGSRE